MRTSRLPLLAAVFALLLTVAGCGGGGGGGEQAGGEGGGGGGGGGGQGAWETTSPALASVTFTSGQPALAAVPPALAVATPVFGSTLDCTSSLTKAFTSCAMAGAAAVANTIASIAANNINFLNSYPLC